MLFRSVPVLRAERHLLGEAHLLKGFVRFSDYDGALAAVITPKNFILPFISDHFCSRYRDEDFMIFDRAHGAALMWKDKRKSLVSVDKVTLPPPSGVELKYRELWRQFYDTVAIESRLNPRCRMSHLPKRFWADMTELHDKL